MQAWLAPMKRGISSFALKRKQSQILQAVGAGDVRSLEKFFLLDCNFINRYIAEYTPLKKAVEANQVRIAEWLLARGADVNLGAPIVDAAYDGNQDMILVFLAANARLNLKEKGSVLKWVRHISILRLLLLSGADVNYPDSNGVTPVMAAKTAEILQELISQKANVDMKNNDGHTALMLACRAGAVGRAKILLENKANPYIRSPSGATALTLAIDSDNADLVSLLLANGIDFRREDNAYRKMTGVSLLDTCRSRKVNMLLAATLQAI
jgi:ankyrin repeat protein